MRVVVDYTACEANAFCEAIAPETFAVDEADQLHVRGEPTDENLDRVRRAVDACPRAALSLRSE